MPVINMCREVVMISYEQYKSKSKAWFCMTRRLFYVCRSVHYVISSWIYEHYRNKLKPEYAGLPGDKIRDLRKIGTEVSERVMVPEVRLKSMGFIISNIYGFYSHQYPWVLFWNICIELTHDMNSVKWRMQVLERVTVPEVGLKSTGFIPGHFYRVCVCHECYHELECFISGQ